jgi:putative spermidine/putrescine transport system ATP-binding protein
MTAQALPGVTRRQEAFGRIRLEHVSRIYGQTYALRDFDLTIPGGEFVALLGPSGCGKSTALNCLSGLIPLSEGAIWVDERRIDTLLPEHRGFGMVFQNYALFPHLPVFRNVAFGLEMRHVPKDEVNRRVTRALDLVHLTAHAQKYPGQLSGGQQQRVAIARAIVTEPPLVLMDEPLSNLDAKLRLEMRSEIKRLHRELGFTTVYVTHDQEEALSLADRLVLLREGVVQQVGSPHEVYAQPVNLYVANFMGYRNTLELAVERSDNKNVVLSDGIVRLTGLDRGVGGARRGVAAIRPQDITVGATANPMAVDVDVVEYQGREFLVEGITKSGKRLIFLSEHKPEIGETLVVGVSPERVLVFPDDDAVRGERA